MAILHGVISEVEAHGSFGGWGRRVGFGRNAAVLVIDMNYDFIGCKPQPVLESIKCYSCGGVGGAA
jgi:maleamate amidohydrolase